MILNKNPITAEIDINANSVESNLENSISSQNSEISIETMKEFNKNKNDNLKLEVIINLL